MFLHCTRRELREIFSLTGSYTTWPPVSSTVDIRREKENGSLMSRSLNPRLPGYHLRQPKRKTKKI